MKSFLTTITILYTTLLSAAIYQENITSGGSGNWSDPNFWLPVGVPTMNDTAIINDATIIVDVSTMVKCLTLENTGRIRTNFSMLTTNPSILIYNKALVASANNNQVFQPNIYVYNSAIKKINSNVNTLKGFVHSYGNFDIFANGGDLRLDKIGTHQWALNTSILYGSGIFTIMKTGLGSPSIELVNP